MVGGSRDEIRRPFEDSPISIARRVLFSFRSHHWYRGGGREKTFNILILTEEKKKSAESFSLKEVACSGSVRASNIWRLSGSFLPFHTCNCTYYFTSIYSVRKITLRPCHWDPVRCRPENMCAYACQMETENSNRQHVAQQSRARNFSDNKLLLQLLLTFLSIKKMNAKKTRWTFHSFLDDMGPKFVEWHCVVNQVRDWIQIRFMRLIGRLSDF